MRDRIIIGHQLKHDLAALMLTHPPELIRDTAKYKPLHGAGGMPRSLKNLAKELLGLDIQNGPHSSVEDSKAVLMIFKQVQHAWDQQLHSQKPKQSISGEQKFKQASRKIEIS